MGRLDELRTLEPYTEAPAKDQAAYAAGQLFGNLLVFGNLLTQLKEHRSAAHVDHARAKEAGSCTGADRNRCCEGAKDQSADYGFLGEAPERGDRLFERSVSNSGAPLATSRA